MVYIIIGVVYIALALGLACCFGKCAKWARDEPVTSVLAQHECWRRLRGGVWVPLWCVQGVLYFKKINRNTLYTFPFVISEKEDYRGLTLMQRMGFK